MSTALYRRYRPQTFAEVIGQEHVTDPLQAALRSGRINHAYLFSGPRGCGKTTSARILARCLNCAKGPTDVPCGECDSCRELATGGPGSIDVVEIDAASHNGVDDARELRERAAFAPARDRYKIFILDEAHMVTQQGFNALLKLVEEPPEHVKFVFATTEPDKVLGTIKSRTHHYPFRLVPPPVLQEYLEQLCTSEGISVGEGVLGLVVRAGGGSVRDSLSVLDQLMAGAEDGHVSYERAVALLGYTDSALLDDTVMALGEGNGAMVFNLVERLVDSGHDPRRFVEDFLQRLRDLVIMAVAPQASEGIFATLPQDAIERMRAQAALWGPGPLSAAADLTAEAYTNMTGATSPRLLLELLLARIMVAKQQFPAAPAASAVPAGNAGGAPSAQSGQVTPSASNANVGGAGTVTAASVSGAEDDDLSDPLASIKASFQRNQEEKTASAEPEFPEPIAAAQEPAVAPQSTPSQNTAGSTPAPSPAMPVPAVTSESVTDAPVGQSSGPVAPQPAQDNPPAQPAQPAAQAPENQTVVPESQSFQSPAAMPESTSPEAESQRGESDSAAKPVETQPAESRSVEREVSESVSSAVVPPAPVEAVFSPASEMPTQTAPANAPTEATSTPAATSTPVVAESAKTDTPAPATSEQASATAGAAGTAQGGDADLLRSLKARWPEIIEATREFSIVAGTLLQQNARPYEVVDGLVYIEMANPMIVAQLERHQAAVLQGLAKVLGRQVEIKGGAEQQLHAMISEAKAASPNPTEPASSNNEEAGNTPDSAPVLASAHVTPTAADQDDTDQDDSDQSQVEASTESVTEDDSADDLAQNIAPQAPVDPQAQVELHPESALDTDESLAERSADFGAEEQPAGQSGETEEGQSPAQVMAAETEIPADTPLAETTPQAFAASAENLVELPETGVEFENGCQAKTEPEPDPFANYDQNHQAEFAAVSNEPSAEYSAESAETTNSQVTAETVVAPAVQPEPVREEAAAPSAPKPQPEPVFEAQPKPETQQEPVTAVQPEPVVVVEPEVGVAPEPEPQPEPALASQSEPEPAPEPTAEPAPAPEPVVASEPDAQTQPESGPTVQPAPEPGPEPEPEPVLSEADAWGQALAQARQNQLNADRTDNQLGNSGVSAFASANPFGDDAAGSSSASNGNGKPQSAQSDEDLPMWQRLLAETEAEKADEGSNLSAANTNLGMAGAAAPQTNAGAPAGGAFSFDDEVYLISEEDEEYTGDSEVAGVAIAAEVLGASIIEEVIES
ncbi:DNA polymerase III subunit gamma and tau [Boudabousia tangfeifanii]|uniref:DNA polymerase III subunit gamma and tau n=1 Tax=Boudabousia tangfeifanii TaxID=1912795 RepID=UPI0009F2E368|nr:DNA polymerase III subunit gamma and tau [Boudabousia tangfeifanii]